MIETSNRLSHQRFQRHPPHSGGRATPASGNAHYGLLLRRLLKTMRQGSVREIPFRMGWTCPRWQERRRPRHSVRSTIESEPQGAICRVQELIPIVMAGLARAQPLLPCHRLKEGTAPRWGLTCVLGGMGWGSYEADSRTWPKWALSNPRSRHAPPRCYLSPRATDASLNRYPCHEIVLEVLRRLDTREPPTYRTG